MFLQSVAPTWAYDWWYPLALAIKSAPAPATALNVHLFTAYTKAPNPNSVAADFTEATFGGYAPQNVFAVTVGPVLLTNGLGSMIHGEGDFIADGTILPPGQTILGYWVDNGAVVPKVVLSELFVTPVPIVLPFDALSLDVIFPITFTNATGQ